MKQDRVPLRTFVSEYSVRNKDSADIPVYSVTNSQGFCKDYFGKEVASKDKKTYKIVPYGYFAYNPSRINVGSVDWQRVEERVIVSPLYNVFSVSEKIDRQYLYYFLKSDIGRQMIKAKASGSVRDNLKLDVLKELTVPNISKEKQKCCAYTLDMVKHLIELRKKQLDEFDELIKARFVEMFGDGYKNKVVWELATIGDIACFIKSGLSRKLDDTDIGLPVIRSTNMINGSLDITQVKYWYKNDPQGANTSDYFLDDGDVLVNFINSAAHIGKVCIYRDIGRDSIYTTNILRVKLNEKCNPVFFNIWAMMDFYKNQIENIIQPAVNQSSFTTANFKKINIPLPPIELQNQFADFVKQVDKSKVVGLKIVS